jgi:phage terminase large subunit-like protein
MFEFWALPHQLPPGGDWKTWVIMGGRGAGKTRAGAEWVRSQVEGRKARRPRPRPPGGAGGRDAGPGAARSWCWAKAASWPVRRPTAGRKWIASRNILEWPNGARAQLFSAHDPEALRGPQFDAAWADELAKWPKAQRTWDQLQFGLRLGRTRSRW